VSGLFAYDVAALSKSLSDTSPPPAAGKSPAVWHRDFDLVLEPTRGLSGVRLGELWHFRELLYFLTARDVKVRYKQTALGVVWAVLQPVLAMIVFTVVFGHVAKVDSGGVPYPIFAYSALVPWFFFANAAQLASNSLIVNPQLITKVYFPRIFLAMAPILAGVVDFLLALTILMGMMAYYEVTPLTGATFLLLPLMGVAFLTTVGLCAWLSALNVKYRDVRFVVPFLVQIWLFATPVVYSISVLSDGWQTIYGLNPMTSVVVGFRWALAGGPPLHASTAVLSVASAITLFVLGVYYFYRTEKSFADVI
jgi:lipopolysaccharide transport system permease protein